MLAKSLAYYYPLTKIITKTKKKPSNADYFIVLFVCFVSFLVPHIVLYSINRTFLNNFPIEMEFLNDYMVMSMRFDEANLIGSILTGELLENTTFYSTQ